MFAYSTPTNFWGYATGLNTAMPSAEHKKNLIHKKSNDVRHAFQESHRVGEAQVALRHAKS